MEESQKPYQSPGKENKIGCICWMPIQQDNAKTLSYAISLISVTD